MPLRKRQTSVRENLSLKTERKRAQNYDWIQKIWNSGKLARQSKKIQRTRYKFKVRERRSQFKRIRSLFRMHNTESFRSALQELG